MSLRAAIYCRVSLDDQVDGYSLSSQERAGKEYAKAKGYEIAEVLIEEGYSGTDLDRPKLHKLRGLIRSRAINVVIVYAQDRLSRKHAHTFILYEEAERNKVAFEYVSSPSGTDTPEQRMMLNMTSAFAEYEREKIRERTMRGRREKAKQGFTNGGRVAFGYKYLGKSDGSRGELLIDPEKAAVVKQIFQWACDGISLRDISVRLNEGCIPPMYSGRWGHSTINRIVRNETYIGRLYYNRRRTAEPEEPSEEHRLRKNKKTVLRERDRSEWIEVAVPAIIDESVFRLANEQISKNGCALAGKPSDRYLLRALLFCSCGKPFAGNPCHGVEYYRCLGRDRIRGNGCRAGQIKATRIEGPVWDAVANCFSSQEFLEQTIRDHLNRFRREDDRAAEVVRLRKQADQLWRKEQRAVESLLDEDLSEHHQRIRRTIEELKQARRRALEEIELTTAAHQLFRSVDSYVGELVLQAKTGIKSLLPKEKRRFLATLVDRIITDGSTAVIHCHVDLLVPQTAGTRTQCAADWAAGFGQDNAGAPVREHPAAAHL